MKQNIECKDILVLGDDSLVALSGKINLNLFLRYARKFGMMINIKTTQICSDFQDVKFLGYIINNDNPSRPLKELCRITSSRTTEILTISLELLDYWL